MSGMAQLLGRYNPWWDGRFKLQGIIKRDRIFERLLKAHRVKDIVLLTGLRRVGKTTLMRLMIQHLIETGDDKRRIFYTSLDDYAFRGKSLAEIIDQFRAIHRLSHSEHITLFLDEVTALPDFEVQLKNINDLSDVKIYASSSSASILREGGGHITGRKRLINVHPLDFEEYLKFKKIDIPPADSHLLKGYFEDYMRTGGIPDFVLTGDVSYLRELIDDIICKDIAAVNGIKNIGLLREFFMLLMERAGKSVSINKIAKVLQISPSTSARFLDHFERSFLVSLISRHGKLNEKIRTPKKLYSVDLGIRVLFTGYRDIGSLFENYIYHLIAERRPEFLFVENIEIDFITEDGALIESKYYDSLRPKQQALYDKFTAKSKMVVDSVEALSLLRDPSPYRSEQHQLKEKVAEYALSTDSTITNLGRSPGRLEVGTK